MLEAVKEGLWEWPEHVSVSPMAKAFVAGLLVVDPSNRLTCEQALNHCWMQVGALPPPISSAVATDGMAGVAAVAQLMFMLKFRFEMESDVAS